MSVFGDGLEVLKLVDKGHNAPLFRQLGEYIEKVADLQKERDDLKAETMELRERLRFKGSLERINGHTFIQGDDEEICPRCAEVDSQLVHMMSKRQQKIGWPLAGCPECKTNTNRPLALNRQQASKDVVTSAV